MTKEERDNIFAIGFGAGTLIGFVMGVLATAGIIYLVTH